MNSLFDELGLADETPTEKLARDLADADLKLIVALRRTRIERGMTQAELGAIMGVSQATVSDFESGSSEPKLSTVRRYAFALRVLVSHEVKPAANFSTGCAWTTQKIATTTHRLPTDLGSYRVAKARRADFALGA
ncbi:MAG: helix-turn-helix transcriptional regulator [Herbiconiux sp.]|nr:helix-turn-helix transcriptional regulator [Herbiconiux sp.]